MNLLKKYLGFFVFSLLIVNSFGLTAKHHSDKIRTKDVVGVYQFSGFSSSASETEAGVIQSQATVGQLEFFRDNTGLITFADVTVIVDGNLTDIHRENVPFTYTLGAIDGYAVATINNFPVAGQNPVFVLSFKKHNGKVVGFSQIVVGNNVPTPRWTLIQGERFD